ncbi:hypothetical protein [Halorientalis salina]|uniref:hypothetical protein n=1 Tax=Halorientalis salina TaxID=2932266 RepID=UPI0010AC8F25|nr:hypothetical protein [Halorientalis salina]
MTRNAIRALLVVTVVLVSGPALAGAATPTGSDDGAATETVIVRNAQVETAQVNGSTVENVTIRTLRIDRMTVQNQTDGEPLNETLGAQGDGPVVLRNVHFRNLSLENTAVEGLTLSDRGSAPDSPGQSAGTANETQQGGTAQVGNVSGAVIEEMTVDRLVVGEANVSDGDGGGVVGDIIERIGGLFGGDGGQNETEPVTQPALRIGSVDVNRLTVQQLDIERVQQAETTGNETTPGTAETGGTNQTALGRVTAENATIGTLSADAMVYQQTDGNGTETPAGNAPEAPAATESGPT